MSTLVAGGGGEKPRKKKTESTARQDKKRGLPIQVNCSYCHKFEFEGKPGFICTVGAARSENSHVRLDGEQFTCFYCTHYPPGVNKPLRDS